MTSPTSQALSGSRSTTTVNARFTLNPLCSICTLLAGSIERPPAEPVKVDVASAEDADDLGAAWQVDQPVQQRADWRGGGAFDDQLAARHHPEDRVEDLDVRQGH